MKKAKDYLIFPLDVPTYEEAIRYVALLKEHVGIFKIGLELFVSVGPKILNEIRERSEAGIFLDLKFHDIPATVKNAFLAASTYGVTFTTVHCDEGKDLLRSVVDNNPSGTRILAVTVLTSLESKNLKELGYQDRYVNDLTELVILKARMAKEAGCSGVVCSGLEVKKVKAELGKDFIAVTPGIRPEWSIVRKDDQKRIITPNQAIKRGADYIVVGRPIRTAEKPIDAAKRVLGEIEMAISE
ncbi:MAG: orotidine-5'-phosphate decarboxylase [Desulfobacteraceae bacterium]|nr:MAG: orotidine-5'-phosphate decarboxylase [Desulfobacteraceae bacterium]